VQQTITASFLLANILRDSLAASNMRTHVKAHTALHSTKKIAG